MAASLDRRFLSFDFCFLLCLISLPLPNLAVTVSKAFKPVEVTTWTWDGAGARTIEGHRHSALECTMDCNLNNLTCNAYIYSDYTCTIGYLLPQDVFKAKQSWGVEIMLQASVYDTVPLHVGIVAKDSSGQLAVVDFLDLTPAQVPYPFPVPDNVQDQVGMYFRDSFWLCGGTTLSGAMTPDCDTHAAGRTTWWTSEDTKLPERRRHFRVAFLFFNDLWCTGGQTTSEYATQTTLTSQGGPWRDGPNLPIGVREHCLAELLPGLFILAAGEDVDGNLVQRTWTYDWREPDAGWQEQGFLNQARKQASCESVTWSNGEKRVVIAGGIISASGTQTNLVETFSLTDNAWTPLTSHLLPHAMDSATSLFVQGHMYLIGGIDNAGAPQKTVYRFDINSGWELMSFSIPVAAANPVLFVFNKL